LRWRPGTVFSQFHHRRLVDATGAVAPQAKKAAADTGTGIQRDA